MIAWTYAKQSEIQKENALCDTLEHGVIKSLYHNGGLFMRRPALTNEKEQNLPESKVYLKALWAEVFKQMILFVPTKMC